MNELGCSLECCELTSEVPVTPFNHYAIISEGFVWQGNNRSNRQTHCSFQLTWIGSGSSTQMDTGGILRHKCKIRGCHHETKKYKT